MFVCLQGTFETRPGQLFESGRCKTAWNLLVPFCLRLGDYKMPARFFLRTIEHAELES